jgi:F-type H+-transporting ATPase subunit a
VNTDANSPLAIALWSFIFVELWGLQSLGSKYLGKFFAFPPFAKGSGPIGVFVGFLELLSEFIRIISFTFRLFGNIFAGDVLILFMSFLVPFILPTIFYGLETFVGFIQAAVFALLTLVFAVMAVEHHDEGGHEVAEAHGAHVEAAAH